MADHDEGGMQGAGSGRADRDDGDRARVWLIMMRGEHHDSGGDDTREGEKWRNVRLKTISLDGVTEGDGRPVGIVTLRIITWEASHRRESRIGKFKSEHQHDFKASIAISVYRISRERIED